jgi:hypothetical protein
MAAGLSASESTGVVKNLAQLLKPGGAMQWEECDFTAVCYLPGGAHSSIDTASKMGKLFSTAMRLRFEAGMSWPQVCMLLAWRMYIRRLLLCIGFAVPASA